MKAWILVASASVLAGAASAPGRMQDPPGHIGVDQPAGVSAKERHTVRDVTDTLRGGGRTDVIAGKRAARRASGPAIVRPSSAHSTVKEGTPARASFGGAESGSTAVVPQSQSSTGPAHVDGSGSTVLGTDLGYGTGTEPVAPSR